MIITAGAACLPACQPVCSDEDKARCDTTFKLHRQSNINFIFSFCIPLPRARQTSHPKFCFLSNFSVFFSSTHCVHRIRPKTFHAAAADVAAAFAVTNIRVHIPIFVLLINKLGGEMVSVFMPIEWKCAHGWHVSARIIGRAERDREKMQMQAQFESKLTRHTMRTCNQYTVYG